jgi:hypothetical protein
LRRPGAARPSVRSLELYQGRRQSIKACDD